MNPDQIALRPPAAPTTPDDFWSSDRFTKALRRVPMDSAALKLKAQFDRMRKPGTLSGSSSWTPPPPSQEWTEYHGFLARYFPELFSSPEIPLLLQIGGNPDVLFQPYHTWKQVTAWKTHREQSVRWSGRNEVLSLMHVCDTRDHDQCVEIASLIRAKRVTVQPPSKEAFNYALGVLEGTPSHEETESDEWPVVAGFADKSAPPALMDRLRNSKAIFKAIGLPWTRGDWKSFASWAKQTRTPCPIRFGRPGSRPSVDRADLAAWWAIERPNFGTACEDYAPPSPGEPKGKPEPKPGDKLWDGDNDTLTVKQKRQRR
jgi:hypothetical protein